MGRLLVALFCVVTLALGTALQAKDQLDGVPVVERVDASTLEPGTHRFWLAAGQRTVAQPFFVPVLVAKGNQEGPRLLLTAGVHGDELNGIAVIHRLFADLDLDALQGTVIAVPGVNISGMENHSRHFHRTNDGGSTENLNRIMPGDVNASDSAAVFAGAFWQGVVEGNADLAIDMHTQTRGTRYPLFIFADYRQPDIKRMAELLEPDQVKVDKGVSGTVETELVKAGVPAVTFEIGDPKVYQEAYIARAVTGVRNVMHGFGMLPGDVELLGVATFVGNEYTTLRTRFGGFVELKVDLNEEVEEGQLLALQRNAFGEEMERFTAPFSGRILSLASDPLREPGSTVARILRLNDDPDCADGC